MRYHSHTGSSTLRFFTGCQVIQRSAGDAVQHFAFPFYSCCWEKRSLRQRSINFSVDCGPSYQWSLSLSSSPSRWWWLDPFDIYIRRSNPTRSAVPLPKDFSNLNGHLYVFSNAVSRYSVRVCVYIRLSCGNQSRDPKKSTIHEFQMSD